MKATWTILVMACLVMMSATGVSAQDIGKDLGLDLGGDEIFKNDEGDSFTAKLKERKEKEAKEEPKADPTQDKASKTTKANDEKKGEGLSKAIREENPKGPSSLARASGEATGLDDMIAYLVSPRFIASRAELRRIDSSPIPELIVIANDNKKKPFVRERAIKCMSLFRDRETKAAFHDMVQSRPDRYFPFIAMSYLEAFGDEAVDDLAPFMNDPDAEVRLTVVKGFGIFGGQKGYDLLVERDKTENNPNVLAQIRNYIQ